MSIVSAAGSVIAQATGLATGTLPVAGADAVPWFILGGVAMVLGIVGMIVGTKIRRR